MKRRRVSGNKYIDRSSNIKAGEECVANILNNHHRKNKIANSLCQTSFQKEGWLLRSETDHILYFRDLL